MSTTPAINTRLREDSQSSVLVVDDDEAIRETLRFLLEDEGYTVHEAASAAEAMDVLQRSQEPIILLVDHLMPGSTGLDFLSKVQQLPNTVELIAPIFMTASAKVQDLTSQAQALDPRIVVVRKPFDLDELMAAVRECKQRLSGGEPRS